MTKLSEIRLTDRISARIASRTALAVDNDEGMSTVEYAIGVVGAGCAAGILVSFFKSPEFHDLLKGLIKNMIKKMVPGF